MRILVLRGLGLALAFLSFVSLSPVSSAAAEGQRLVFENGIDVTVFSPEYILEHLTVRSGNTLYFVVDGTRYEFITSTDDPGLSNGGDGSFHPMDIASVVDGLRDIRHEDVGLQMQVYVLPYPRREVLDSSARNRKIFLSPGVRVVSANAVHFTVVHEVGHLFQYRWLPDHDVAKWERYANLRGIADRSVYNAGAAHANRPHEVFAEDFRYLFGGERANYSGNIENRNLPLPSEVEGLEEMLVALATPRQAAVLQVVPAPNPFNPNTQLQVDLGTTPSGNSNILVRIFDAGGRLVRGLYKGPASAQRFELPWDGRGDNGQLAAGGVYFAHTEYAGSQCTSKLLLVK